MHDQIKYKPTIGFICTWPVYQGTTIDRYAHSLIQGISAATSENVLAVVRGVQDGRGLGVFYWDATWTAVPGNGWESTNPASGNAWENQALFDFDDEVLPALAEYLNP